MSEKQLASNEQAYWPKLPSAKSRRNFDRRRFLGGMALASLTAPFLGAAGEAMAAPEIIKPMDSREQYLNVYHFGARGNGKADDTAAIQKALDTAGKQGGNVVLLPRGAYLVRGALHVPDDVTLQGVFRAPNRGNTGQNMGSLLLATGGKGKPDGTPFISLGENGTLYGLTIFYPEQTCPNPPVEYPWTVRQLSDNGSLVNVTLLNPWQGVDFGTVTGGRHYIHGLYGQPLKTGLFIDKCEDVGRVADVHFWPFWKADAPTMAFTSKEATAFRIGRTDWEYMFNCFAICHKIGYHFVRTPSGVPNVVLTQCGSDEGAPDTRSISVRVDGNQSHAGISFVNGQFMGAPSIEVGSTNTGPVKFTNCGFWGGPLTDTMAILEGSGQTTFTGCHFISWAQQNKKAPAVVLRRGRLIINGCEFMDAGQRQVAIERGAAAAVILGNSFQGPAHISNQIGAKAKISMNAVD
ncbi:MAG: glycosyl hydrolase family 28-related protein [Phycisphaerae bacterium]